MWRISFNDCIFSLTCMRAAYQFIKKREGEGGGGQEVAGGSQGLLELEGSSGHKG